MPWRSVSVVEQRLEFCRLAVSGEVPLAVLCRRFGISRVTGYKWLARYRAEGEAGLVDRRRVPLRSPGRTSAEMEQLVVDVRKDHEAWGGRKIRGFLLRAGHEGVPAASTITQILRRHDLLESPPPPAAYTSFEHAVPNDLWQMDFKGWVTLTSGMRVHPLGILDDHSRYNLCLAACADQRTGTVRALLEATFGRFGLPQAMLMDNGSPWGNGRGQPWTPLTVWLVDLGIRVIHSRPFHPQTAGKEERFHLTLELEVLSRRSRWDHLDELQDAFDQWRVVYNHQRPHQALGETVVPADRYQPSPRPFPDRIDPPVYPDGTDVRKVSSSAVFSWRGRRWRAGKAFAGRYIGIRPTPTDGIYHVYYRHHHIRTINLTL